MRQGWIAAVGAALLTAAGAPAQQGGYTGSGYGGSQSYGSQPVPQNEQTMPSRMPMQDRDASRTKPPPPPTKEEMIKDASGIAASIQLSCAVTDANLLGQGKSNINGQPVDTKNYEVACQNGMGYLLSSSPPVQVIGYSCFAADHSHAKDPTSNTCTMPANADVKAAAARVLAGLGAACQPTAVNWLGANPTTEFTEVACTGGKGYVLSGPMPGKSVARVAAMTCVDAVKQGITCKMSNSGPPPITLDTFKQALAQHNVNCDAANVRSLGKETTLKRHVVEFQCPQQHPEGLVALIPLQDSTAPFETISCAQAATRYHVICAYVK